MNKLIFISGLLLSITSVFAQVEVEPFDLGLRTIERTYSNEDKYGPDRSKWPVWAMKRVWLSMFSEDSVHLDQFTYNDYFLFSFDPSRPFTERVFDHGREITKSIDQGDLNFWESKGGIEFSYLNLEAGRTGDVDVLLDGKVIDANSLRSMKEAFPNSYRWRDGRSNMLYSGYHPDSTIHMTTLDFFELKQYQMLQLYYYKDDLIYINTY